MTHSYDPETVRAMLVEAYRAGVNVNGPADYHPDEDVDRILAAHPAPAPSGAHVGSPKHVALWDAVNALVTASGGSSTTSVARQKAVTRVEEALATLLAPAPSPAPIAALHASAVERVMRVLDVVLGPVPVLAGRYRASFEAAITEALAPSPPSELHVATNKDAAELMSAAEWLDKTDGRWTIEAQREKRGATWCTVLSAPRDTATTHSAILAAARSLGWPGGGK